MINPQAAALKVDFSTSRAAAKPVLLDQKVTRDIQKEQGRTESGWGGLQCDFVHFAKAAE